MFFEINLLQILFFDRRMMVLYHLLKKLLAQIFANSDELSQHETESITLSLVDIQRLTDKLWSLPLEDRRNLPGLPANRADVILIGAVIYKTVMKQFGFSELRPTLRGVRYGALLD